MSGDESQQKRALRAELRARRRTATSVELDRATEGLSTHLAQLVTELGARAITAYLPTQDEPDIRPFLQWALGEGIRVLLPISRDDGLLDWVAYDEGEETIGLFGMPEAVGELLGPIAVHEVDLMLIPAAAVDRSGMRLGWGRGYFDRTLGSMETSPPVYAVIFDSELVDEVPTELHDKAVDGAVTPAGIVRFPR